MKILIVTNDSKYTYVLRKELLSALLALGEVIVCCPSSVFDGKLIRLGCDKINISYNRRGLNPISDLLFFFRLCTIIRRLKPDVILSFTVKPNIYCGLISRMRKILFIPNITGLGDSFETNKLLSHIMRYLYKVATKKARIVFFQNDSNKEFFINNIQDVPFDVLPGSGIDTDSYEPSSPFFSNETRVLYLGRIMRSKGIDVIKALVDNREKINKPIHLTIAGKVENSNDIIEYLRKFPFVEILEEINDPKELILHNEILLNPSYHEGMSNVVLEACALERPAIVSNIPGCYEIIKEGHNGFLFNKGDHMHLIEKINQYNALSLSEKITMGRNARIMVKENFSRSIVIKKYLKAITESIYGATPSH